ncbi:MAG TPA: helix-turn-helix transcriptional regulator [Bosea sp. (in: a-proteobacteria)]
MLQLVESPRMTMSFSFLSPTGYSAPPSRGADADSDDAGRGAKPLFIIDADLRIHFSNQGAAALAREGLGAGGRLVCADKLFSARLQTWLKRRCAGAAPEEIRLSLSTRCGRQIVVDAVHLGGAGMDLFVLTVDDPQRMIDRNVDEVAEACGLTPTEARMLGLIVKGLDTVVAAKKLGIARTTARTHLQRLFAKTGTARQSELVRFVATFIEEAA